MAGRQSLWPNSGFSRQRLAHFRWLGRMSAFQQATALLKMNTNSVFDEEKIHRRNSGRAFDVKCMRVLPSHLCVCVSDTGGLSKQWPMWTQRKEISLLFVYLGYPCWSSSLFVWTARCAPVSCPECVRASNYRKRTGRNHRKDLPLRLEQTANGGLKSGHCMLTFRNLASHI